MIQKYLQLETLSVVFVGKFNPVIIQPYWLLNKGLIKEIEAEKAEIIVIHNEIVKYNLAWVNIEVTKERFELKTVQKPYFDPTRDLAVNIFRILSETPITAVGINQILEYKLPDEKTYYDFGNKLSPLSFWDESLNDPKLLQLEILEKERYDQQPGQRRIRILPSENLRPTGISININDHFELATKNSSSKILAIDVLTKNWEKSHKDSRELIDKLWNKLQIEV